MANPLTSIRSNSMPQGGVTALQAVPPEQVPAEIAALVSSLQPLITQFRQQSTDMTISLDTATYKNPGDSKSVRITSVGLGYRVRSHHNAVIYVSNTNAAAETINVSPYFPFNTLSNTNVQINGGTSVYSASGRAGLAVAARTKRGFFIPVNNGLTPAFCRVTFGAGLTPTQATTFSLSGYSSFNIAATTNNATITCDFYTIEKLAYSRDTLLGALPLQNNSVYAQLTRTLAQTIIGSDATAPLYMAGGAPAGVSASYNSFTTDSKYDFWSVPSNPALYAPMVNNSYQVQEAQNLTTSATGAAALKYDLPTNQFLVAAHVFAVDKNNAALSWNALPKVQLQYNGGSIIPVTQEVGTQRADQFMTYGADIFQLPGYRLWDGDATSDMVQLSDEAGWIDAYSAATPQLVADVDTAVSTPITFSVTRESIVAGAVNVVG